MGLRIAAMAGVLLVLCSCCHYHSAEASEFTVGDTHEWGGIGYNYTTWASTKTFLVGDTVGI